QAEVLKADMTDSKLGPAEAWTSRQALQDLYQKMLVTDLEYALDKKVEQDLWNHAFKNQITTLQGQAKNRSNPNRSEVQANLSLFLEAASGFYTQLATEIRPARLSPTIDMQLSLSPPMCVCLRRLKSFFLNCSSDEVKTQWGVCDFIKAFIKFHGHVYLSKNLEKLNPLREKLEEQFKRLLFQKTFNSQQLVHITVINLFQLHHLRDFSNETEQHSYSQDEQLCWTQLLALFMSFLGILCKCPLQNDYQEESWSSYPLPALKVSMDWLKLRPSVFQETVVDERQYIWPWLISLLNSFQPHEEDLSCPNGKATPLSTGLWEILLN
ncbi:hypothetical protein lerEdw1_002534, partial [Lerista edwardsae]